MEQTYSLMASKNKPRLHVWQSQCLRMKSIRHLLNLDLQMKILLIFISIFLSSVLSAQKSTVKYNNRIGLNAGFTTGLGFTYGYYPDKLGIQVSFLPIYGDNSKFLSLAITPLYTLSENHYFKSYFFMGNHLVYKDKITEYNIGIGPGIELGQRVVFSIRGGFGLFDVTKSFNILPTLEMGLFFKY